MVLGFIGLRFRVIGLGFNLSWFYIKPCLEVSQEGYLGTLGIYMRIRHGDPHWGLSGVKRRKLQNP